MKNNLKLIALSAAFVLASCGGAGGSSNKTSTSADSQEDVSEAVSTKSEQAGSSLQAEVSVESKSEDVSAERKSEDDVSVERKSEGVSVEESQIRSIMETTEEESIAETKEESAVITVEESSSAAILWSEATKVDSVAGKTFAFSKVECENETFAEQMAMTQEGYVIEFTESLAVITGAVMGGALLVKTTYSYVQNGTDITVRMLYVEFNGMIQYASDLQEDGDKLEGHMTYTGDYLIIHEDADEESGMPAHDLYYVEVK